MQHPTEEGEQSPLTAPIEADVLGPGSTEQLDDAQEIEHAPAEQALAEQDAVAMHHVVHAVGLKEAGSTVGHGHRLAQTPRIKGIQGTVRVDGLRPGVTGEILLTGDVRQVEVDRVLEVQCLRPVRLGQPLLQDGSHVALRLDGVAPTGLASERGGPQHPEVRHPGDLALPARQVQQGLEATACGDGPQRSPTGLEASGPLVQQREDGARTVAHRAACRRRVEELGRDGGDPLEVRRRLQASVLAEEAHHGHLVVLAIAMGRRSDEQLQVLRPVQERVDAAQIGEGLAESAAIEEVVLLPQ